MTETTTTQAPLTPESATADAVAVLEAAGIRASVESRPDSATPGVIIATEVTPKRGGDKHDVLRTLLHLPGVVLSTDPDERGRSVTIWRRETTQPPEGGSGPACEWCQRKAHGSCDGWTGEPDDPDTGACRCECRSVISADTDPETTTREARTDAEA